MLKKLLPFLLIATAVGIGLTGCFNPVESIGANQSRAAASIVVWNSVADKSLALNIDGVLNNTRKNASGAKITSGANSAEFPGVYFIWDSKQGDSGYLKVDANIFKKYVYFVITTKESNNYYDFKVMPQIDQKKTSDGCYVFYIPGASNNKNINMVFIDEALLVPLDQVPLPANMADLYALIDKAQGLKANDYYTVQVSMTGDGSDVDMGMPWVTNSEMASLDFAIQDAQEASAAWAGDAIANLQQAMDDFNACIKMDGSNPYFRLDPGAGIQRLVQATLPITADSVPTWVKANPNDGRLNILEQDQCSMEYIDNPFTGQTGGLAKLTTYANPNLTSPTVSGRSFAGFGFKANLSNSVAVNSNTYIEFDLYYPFSAAGKYMRLEIWSGTAGGSQQGGGVNGSGKAQAYIRTANLTAINNLNPDWVDNYMGDTWSMVRIVVPVATTATWSSINIDIHGETGMVLNGDVLMIGNFSITKPDPNGVAIPDVVDTQSFSVVDPIRGKYNPEDGLFLVGAIGTGTVTPDSVRGRHYEIFVDGNNLKADSVHPRYPAWLTSPAGSFSGSVGTTALNEYSFPTSSYQQIRDSGTPGEYLMHGHTLAWYNQAPGWMTQIVPENLQFGWNGDDNSWNFYSNGNNAGVARPVSKDMARRVQYNHVMYELRHFMTTDPRYGSSDAQGLIPFHSFDVLNEEIHESRHSTLIRDDPNIWKAGLKNTSWLAAMMDNDYADISQHYVYLLFKYAHMAVPNAQMIAKIDANLDNPDVIPAYMKVDGHLDNLDTMTFAAPPLL
ncbi:MAG: endo-1,4-beta-xylanase, partial [Treponema sp.]|nr:endo-1,4-beta-xylanase [Treponema sp.]